MYCLLGTEAYFREQNRWQRAAVGKKNAEDTLCSVAGEGYLAAQDSNAHW